VTAGIWNIGTKSLLILTSIFIDYLNRTSAVFLCSSRNDYVTTPRPTMSDLNSFGYKFCRLIFPVYSCWWGF